MSLYCERYAETLAELDERRKEADPIEAHTPTVDAVKRAGALDCFAIPGPIAPVKRTLPPAVTDVGSFPVSYGKPKRARGSETFKRR